MYVSILIGYSIKVLHNFFFMAVKLKLKLMSEAGVLIYSFNVGYYLVVYVCDGAGGDGGGLLMTNSN